MISSMITLKQAPILPQKLSVIQDADFYVISLT